MTQPSTPADLQAFIDHHQISARLHLDLGDTPTVPAAAAVLGVEADQIIKTLLFLVEPIGQPAQPVVVISHGERRVDRGRLARHFAVAKGRINFAPAETVLNLIGYPAGGVPPFGHRSKLLMILDESVVGLKERYGGVVFGGGGDHHAMIEVSVDELMRVTEPLVLAVS